MKPATSTNPPGSRTASAHERMDALARVCGSLGHAIQGAGQLGPAGATQIKELTDQLIAMARRVASIERTAEEP